MTNNDINSEIIWLTINHINLSEFMTVRSVLEVTSLVVITLKTGFDVPLLLLLHLHGSFLLDRYYKLMLSHT